MDSTSGWLALLLLVNYQLVPSDALLWSKWSWDMPQDPLVGKFRKAKHMNFKKMGNFPECVCPPSAECKLDYKFNEGALEFLHMRGVLKGDKMMQVMEDMESIKNDVQTPGETRRYKRNNDCCCPPETILIPAFIASRRFDKIVNMLSNKNDTSLRTKVVMPDKTNFKIDAKPYIKSLP